MTAVAVNRPRLTLGCWPTPLYRADRLSAELAADIWVKRDDLSGFGLGGNKVRILEFLIADALALGCDCLLTGAGPQSNWAFLAALAARRSGLESYLCFYGDEPTRPTGNLLLHHQWTRPRIRWTSDHDRRSVDPLLESTADELRAAGRRPYVLPRGGATPLSTAGYLTAGAEMALQNRVVDAATVWVSTGSCGTQAGLVLGAAAGHHGRVVGVTVSWPAAEVSGRVHRLATHGAELLDTPPPTTGDVTVLDGWIGDGYGIASAEGSAAADLVARTEGILLDPVFGAKAMAALIDALRTGSVTGPVVFIVSGGAPALFGEDGAP